MKIQLIIILIFIGFLKTEFSYSQNDTIRGKIYSSISLKKPKGNIYIIEKGTSNSVIADSLGFFNLIPKTKKSIYSLKIIAKNYPSLIYKYKSSWSNRKKPKSIIIEGKCKLNKEKANFDWKNGTQKLYLEAIAPIKNSKKDKRFEKKFNVKYHYLDSETEIYECISEYNQFTIKILDIKFGEKWRKLKRKEIIGIND